MDTIDTTWDGFAFGGPDTGRYGGWIQTFTERQFWPLDPRVSDIDIRDIAHALGNQCRFSGHCSRFYSVAEHSVRVAWLLEEAEESPHVQLWGLLHDAAEAYLVDIPRPIKHSPGFEAYREAEARVMACVCLAYGLQPNQPHAVTLADRRLLATERRDLLGPNCQWEVPDTVPLRDKLNDRIAGMGWKNDYLDRFEHLTDLLKVSEGLPGDTPVGMGDGADFGWIE